MQCQSYFPVHNSHYDLNVDANGGGRPMYNGNGNFQSGHYNNYNSSLLVPHGCFAYEKQLFRQTILLHEVTFRDQVQELHRLYKRQKELMGEITSKELYMNHFHLETKFSTRFGQNTHCRPSATCTIFSQNGDTLNNLHFPETKGKKIGKIFLDLELPAEVYIDSEEGESLEDARFSKPTLKFLTQSNEVNSEVDSGENPFVGAKMRNGTKGHMDEKFDANLRSSPSFDTRSYLQRNYSESKLKDSMTCMSSINSDHLKHVNGLHYIDLNTEFRPSSDTSSGIILTNSLDCETTRKSKKCRLIDINLPCDPTVDEEPLIEDDLGGHGFENADEKNLNLCMNDDGLPQKCSSLDRIGLEIDLEAPVSPEVEERPPPRGDSEENLLEATLQVSTPEYLAAEAIVFMSSYISQPRQETTSDNGTLEWFAGLIHTMSSDVESDFVKPGFDDFEAMTLNLTEMKPEECWSKNGGTHIENLTCSMSLPGQMRKGRTRRSKRKDFQREVLPSLACLSRYEVMEDIQIIEGLTQAAGSPWHLSRTRKACRMGRRSRDLKPQTSTSDFRDLKYEFVISWGKVNRRPRGRRIPATPSTVLSKWARLHNLRDFD